MGRTSGSFAPGDPRINRNGRPRAGTAFSERGRERIDPDKVLDLAEQVIGDETIPARERLAIVLPVLDRIYTKPEAKHELSVTATAAIPRALGHVSDERLAAIVAELRGDPNQLTEGEGE